MSIPSYVAHAMAKQLLARGREEDPWKAVEDVQYNYEALKTALDSVAHEGDGSEEGVVQAMEGVPDASAVVFLELVCAAYYNDDVKRVAGQDAGKTKGGDATARAIADKILQLAKKQESKSGEWLDAAKLAIRITTKTPTAADSLVVARKALELIVKDRTEQATKKRKAEDPKPKSAAKAGPGADQAAQTAPAQPAAAPVQPAAAPVQPAAAPVQPEMPLSAKKAKASASGELTDDVFATWKFSLPGSPAAAGQPVTPAVDEPPVSDDGWGNCKYLRMLGI